MSPLNGECRTDVYVAALPDGECDLPLYPEERDRAVRETSNSDVRRERYFVWKLLEHAVSQTLGLSLREVRPEMKDGRWTARGFDFSISHGGGALAVAISGSSVGVDIEPLDGDSDCERIARRFFNDGELSLYLSSDGQTRRETFLRIWTAKEAIFKSRSLAAFSPRDTDSRSARVHTEIVRISGRAYVLSVAAEGEVVIHRETIL